MLIKLLVINLATQPLNIMKHERHNKQRTIVVQDSDCIHKTTLLITLETTNTVICYL